MKKLLYKIWKFLKASDLEDDVKQMVGAGDYRYKVSKLFPDHKCQEFTFEDLLGIWDWYDFNVKLLSKRKLRGAYDPSVMTPNAIADLIGIKETPFYEKVMTGCCVRKENHDLVLDFRNFALFVRVFCSLTSTELPKFIFDMYAPRLDAEVSVTQGIPIVKEILAHIQGPSFIKTRSCFSLIAQVKRLGTFSLEGFISFASRNFSILWPVVQFQTKLADQLGGKPYWEDISRQLHTEFGDYYPTNKDLPEKMYIRGEEDKICRSILVEAMFYYFRRFEKQNVLTSDQHNADSGIYLHGMGKRQVWVKLQKGHSMSCLDKSQKPPKNLQKISNKGDKICEKKWMGQESKTGSKKKEQKERTPKVNNFVCVYRPVDDGVAITRLWSNSKGTVFINSCEREM